MARVVMKAGRMRVTTLVPGVLLGLSAIAAAEPAMPTLALVPRPANGNTTALAQSRIIYLNHNGVTLNPGNDDSTAQTSSIINQRSVVPAWNVPAATWQAVVACMQDEYSRFDVTVTDQDPGPVPHIEAVFGGSPQNVGMPSGVGGVSPFTLDCGIIENSIVFTFTDVFPQDAQLICEVMSQETAHSYGLDHEYLASDPMTYLSYSGHKVFQDQTASCGEYQARPCGINGSTCRPNQNSVQLLYSRVGMADAVPPTLGITSPADGAQVEPGFEVDATASDNVGVTSATLLVDGQAAGTTMGAGPFMFTTDPSLADGTHTIEVDAFDAHGNNTPKMITVSVTRGTGSGSGSGSGSGNGNGSGNGSGSGSGGGGPDTGIGGGCSTSGGSVGLLLAFSLIALPRRRRR
jgi:hypothetical protein